MKKKNVLTPPPPLPPPPPPPPGYHHNGFLATHVLQQLWHMMYQVHKHMSYHKAIVVITRSGHCFHDNV